MQYVRHIDDTSCLFEDKYSILLIATIQVLSESNALCVLRVLICLLYNDEIETIHSFLNEEFLDLFG